MKGGVSMRYRGLVALIILPVLSIAVSAVTPQFWENFTQEDLLKGSLDRVSLTSDGKLFLAPAYDLVFDTGQPYIFSMAGDKAGNIYLGTGDEGKVFKVDPQGKGSLYFQCKELDIFAMALDASGTLYVGSSPDGKVYKVTGPNQATEFCDPEDKYIWTMVFDDVGNLYVGTGAGGAIYKVDKGGKKELFYTCSDNHVVSLIRRSDNNFLAGTSPGGLVVEITPGGKGFTLLDTPLEEVRSFAIDRFGVLYAVAAASKGTGASPASKPETTTGKTTATSAAVISIQSIVGLAEASKETKGKQARQPGRRSFRGQNRPCMRYQRMAAQRLSTIPANKWRLMRSCEATDRFWLRRVPRGVFCPSMQPSKPPLLPILLKRI